MKLSFTNSADNSPVYETDEYLDIPEEELVWENETDEGEKTKEEESKPPNSIVDATKNSSLGDLKGLSVYSEHGGTKIGEVINEVKDGKQLYIEVRLDSNNYA